MNIDINIVCPICKYQFANFLLVNDVDLILCTSCFSDSKLVA